MGGDAPKRGRHRRARSFVVSLGLVLGLVLACTAAPGAEEEHSLEVTATAYNSLPSQGQGNPTVAAWGDELRPGMKAVAVSRDLLELGIGHDTVLRIEGMPGEYRVLDKLAKRWKLRIDIYMGDDVEAAREFGKRTVTIRWDTAPAK